MRLGRPATKFVLSPNERGTLERYTRRATTAQSLAARIVLRCAAGDTHTAIAADLHVTQQTVGSGAAGSVDGRVPGLLDEPRPSAPRTIGDAEIERVLTTTRETAPARTPAARGRRRSCGPDQRLDTLSRPRRW